MRILLGYLPDQVHPDTIAALNEAAAPLGIGPELVDVSGSDFAYWEAVRDRWTGEQDLVIIEQDNVIHGQVLPQFGACPGDWCVFPYPIFNSRQRLTQGLGCTKFSAALQRRCRAEEFEADGRMRNGHQDGIPWNFLDLIIADRLKLGHGVRPHVHSPDVEHRHDYGGPVTLPGGDTTADHPALSPYDRVLPVRFDASAITPAVVVYGAELTPVRSLDDAARLANSLKDRYMNDDGTTRELPAQHDASQLPALRFETDKVSQGYLPSYLAIAAELGTSARVCEVGVWQGQSLRMWQALFPGGIIAGVDADPRSTWPAQTARIRCSQDDPSLPGQLAALSPGGWDLIVDDASHEGVQTRRTFGLLWPLVVPGGVYVVEDWFVGFGKHHMFPGDLSMMATAQSFLGLLEEQSGDCESVTYRYGMIIIRKAK